jgi:hypothetical protein
MFPEVYCNLAQVTLFHRYQRTNINPALQRGDCCMSADKLLVSIDPLIDIGWVQPHEFGKVQTTFIPLNVGSVNLVMETIGPALMNQDGILAFVEAGDVVLSIEPRNAKDPMDIALHQKLLGILAFIDLNQGKLPPKELKAAVNTILISSTSTQKL